MSRCTFSNRASGVARFGVPSTVSTDRGRQFESTLWRELTELLGSKRIRTTAYHPSANGLIEQFHRQLKASLKARQPTLWVLITPYPLQIQPSLLLSSKLPWPS